MDIQIADNLQIKVMEKNQVLFKIRFNEQNFQTIVNKQIYDEIISKLNNNIEARYYEKKNIIRIKFDNIKIKLKNITELKQELLDKIQKLESENQTLNVQINELLEEKQVLELEKNKLILINNEIIKSSRKHNWILSSVLKNHLEDMIYYPGQNFIQLFPIRPITRILAFTDLIKSNSICRIVYYSENYTEEYKYEYFRFTPINSGFSYYFQKPLIGLNYIGLEIDFGENKYKNIIPDSFISGEKLNLKKLMEEFMFI